MMFVHKHEDGTATETEEEDWRVSCTITEGEKKIYAIALPLAHPTSFRDAMAAIDQFMRKDGPEVLKAKKEGK